MPTESHKVKFVTKHQSTYHPLLEAMALPGLEITSDPSEATILIASPAELATQLDDFPKLKWVQSIAAGVNQLMEPELSRDYQLTNVKDIFGQQIAEYVLGYSLASLRHFDGYKQQQQQKQWRPLPHQTIAGKKMLILGTGSIGHHLATVANAFGVTTIGVNRSGIPPQGNEFSAIYHIDELSGICANADIIVSTLPHTPATNQLLNHEVLSRCKGALLFNVGRGEVIETQALLDALETGSIAHAYLDVFINEPISQECPYWHHPDVTVTPHVAAHSFAEDVLEIFKDNYLRWIEDAPLINSIDFTRGY